MAKQLFLHREVAVTGVPASMHRGNNDAKLDGTSSWWVAYPLGESRPTTGTGVGQNTNTVTGPTNGVDSVNSSGVPIEWISEPLSAGFTISGTITLNIWGFENSMNANVAINAVIEKLDGATGSLTQIAKTARVIELGTAAAAENFTATPTSTACKRGDRIRVRVFGDDSSAATMATGFVFTAYCGATTAAATGDSWIQFTENLTFEAAGNPTGSTYYLTDTAETINPGSATEKKALTTRGSSSVNSVTNTATGPTAGIQVTATGGGAAIEWYTPPLNAVTLGGKAKFNLRALESSDLANASLKAEIAITATNGTGAVVWGAANVEAIDSNGSLGELFNLGGDFVAVAWVSGDDTSVSSGQRLRFRVFVDDCGDAPLVTGFTTTVTYNGASAAAAGDTYVMLPVAVTEQTAAAVIPDVGMALTVT